MTFGDFILLLIVGAVATSIGAFVLVIVRFNVKRARIIKAVAGASEDALESVYRAIEGTDDDKANACLFVRTNRTASTNGDVISFPGWLRGFPWAGCNLEIVDDARGTRTTKLVLHRDAAVSESVLRGKVVRPLRVPKHRSASGNAARNVWSPRALLKLRPALVSALDVIGSDAPEDVLTYMLAPGRRSHEFDGIFQCRAGHGASWIQGADIPGCAGCKAPMAFVVQVPGEMLSAERAEGVLYVFGCPPHADHIKGIWQYF
jgi:hypothetical protein